MPLFVYAEKCEHGFRRVALISGYYLPGNRAEEK